MRDKIYIVDKNRKIRSEVSSFLREQNFGVKEFSSFEDVVSRAKDEPPRLVIADLSFMSYNGADLIPELRREYPFLPVIIISSKRSVDTAVNAMKKGADDFISEPIDYDALGRSINNCFKTYNSISTRRKLSDTKRSSFSAHSILGKSDKIMAIHAFIDKIATIPTTTVLLRGESGTGKNLVAKAIHFSSENARGPFVEVNCASVPGNLLEAELFGFEKGAFTDAKATKRGIFELADGGTLFLDEIGEMDFGLQSKLLSFMESKMFRRLGGTQNIQVDLRLIIATNANLEEAIEEKKFREDLFYRINVVSLHLPPMRDMKEDLFILANHFMKVFNIEFKKDVHGLSDEAKVKLLNYDWPGNIREMRNVIERAMIFAEENVIRAEDILLGKEIKSVPRASDSPFYIRLPEGGASLEGIERNLIKEALALSGGNQTKAAKLLRISRDTLRYRMDKHNLLNDSKHTEEAVVQAAS